MENNKSGGEVVRELRLQKGITIKKLSELVDTHYVFLSKLERNMEKPSEELIKKLADILDYKDDINLLILSFNRIPKEIEKILLDDPNLAIEIPAFYKTRKGAGKNGRK